jgi:hypothetical protein
MATNTSKETTEKKDDDMAFKNSAITAIKGLVHENKKMREAIEASKQTKKTRKQSSASKIQGLQTLKNTLGTQKTS